jgi:excisionase family DNA binding protein
VLPMSEPERPRAAPAEPDHRERIGLVEAARMCGVDYDTFLRWVSKGVLPHVRVGPYHRKRVYRRDVEKLIRQGP